LFQSAPCSWWPHEAGEYPFSDVSARCINGRLAVRCLFRCENVCTGQSVDGAQAFGGEPGMSAPRAWEMGVKRAPNAPQTPVGGALSRHCGHVSTPNHGQRSFVQAFPNAKVNRRRSAKRGGYQHWPSKWRSHGQCSRARRTPS